MKTSIVDVAVRGQSVGSALKSGAYTVAGTGLCGLGSVLDTAANIGQKVVDVTRAAGEACTEKGEEFLAEAAAIKGEQPAKEEKTEKKAAPQAQKAAAASAQHQAQANKTWSLADFVVQHNEFAEAACAISKEFTKVMFRVDGSMKGVVTAFDAVRRADGALCSVFADMAKKTFSVVAPPKKGEKPVKKAAKKAAAPKQEKTAEEVAPAKKAAAPAKKAIKAEPAKMEEAKEENSMKAALEAACAKKTAAKAKTVKVETKTEGKKETVKAAPKKEAAPAKKEEKSSKKVEGEKEPYSSNPKANMTLEEAVRDHGEWLDKVIRHFQGISTKPLANVAVKSNCLKFSSYGENGQVDAVSVAFKSHKVKVNRKEVKLDL